MAVTTDFIANAIINDVLECGLNTDNECRLNRMQHVSSWKMNPFVYWRKQSLEWISRKDIYKLNNFLVLNLSIQR